MRRCLAVATLSILLPSWAWAQTLPRVYVGASAGVAELRGGSLVPPAFEPALSVRVTARITERLSIDVEGSGTGLREGREYQRRADWQWREDRRELSLGAYLRARVFTTRMATVEPVAGVSRLMPRVRGYQRRYDPFQGSYGPWGREEGILGFNGFYTHETRPAWMLSFGTDVTVGSRRFAVVPEFRVLVPFYEGNGPGVHTRLGIGIRVAVGGLR